MVHRSRRGLHLCAHASEVLAYVGQEVNTDVVRRTTRDLVHLN